MPLSSNMMHVFLIISCVIIHFITKYQICIDVQYSQNITMPIDHAGGRLLPGYYDLYQKLQLQFYRLPMMGAMDTRNM